MDGVWTVMDGVWTVMDGIWTVMDGIWTVMDGPTTPPWAKLDGFGYRWTLWSKTLNSTLTT
ncbi:hypothetical protein ACRQEC_08955 [Actinotignum sp. GS-2025c]|uniref:hypothetical protein n=1 Tax=Actinotignum TaxID=1653174 RepID=UPI00237E2190|nr:hypothetical protein [Actinotignum sanguinis]MDE1552260.1 hypothetical protein [Actinotignum sanguinis]